MGQYTTLVQAPAVCSSLEPCLSVLKNLGTIKMVKTYGLTVIDSGGTDPHRSIEDGDHELKHPSNNRHGIMYNASASKTQQSTSFHKTFNLTFHGINASN